MSNELFHRLWTKAVGTPDYVKDEWIQLEATVVLAGTVPPIFGIPAAIGDVFPITWRTPYLGIERTGRMGATIFWRYLAIKNTSLEVSLPSSFIAAMERAFGSAPWRLGVVDVAKLEGMAAAFGTTNDNPYTKLLNKIQAHPESNVIEVWPEY